MSQHYKIDCDKVEDRKALVVVLSMNGYTVRVGKEKRSGKSTLTYFVEYGKKRLEEERIEYAEEQVVVPANVTAQIFYLKNRKPDKWKDKPQENTTEAQNNDMQTLADLLQRPVPDRDIKDFET